MTQIGATNMYLATEVQDIEKASFTRERSIRMYKVSKHDGSMRCRSPILFCVRAHQGRHTHTNTHAPPQISAYTVSWAIAEIPWVLLSSLTFAIPFYFLCGYYPVPEKFGFFVLYHYLYNLWNALFGHVLGVLFSQQVAQNICSTLGFLLFSFMGLTRAPPKIPNEYAFLFWGLPSHYMLGGIAETQWHDATHVVYSPTFNASVPENYMILDYLFGNAYKYENRWIDMGALIGFSAGTLILLWLSLRFGRMGTR